MIPTQILSILASHIQFGVSLLIVHHIAGTIQIFVFLFFCVDTCHYIQVVFFGKCFGIVYVCVGRPCVLFGKVSPDAAIAFSDDVRGYRFPAPIDAVNGVVLRTAVHILNGICKVCIKGQSFNDFSFQESVHTGQVCCHFTIGSLLLHGHDACVIAVDCARRNEIRTPTPQILVGVGPCVRAFIVLTTIVDACTHL